MWEAAVILAFVGIAGVLIYISTKLDETHVFLKLIFLFTTLTTFLVGLSVINEMVSAADIISSVNIIYYLLLTTTILCFVYYIFYFIYGVFKNKQLAKEEDE